jgi:hypothetical protein
MGRAFQSGLNVICPTKRLESGFTAKGLGIESGHERVA